MKSTYTGPMRLAHRGVTQAAPENTLEAFEAAARMGLEGIEIDVRMSRDGEVVVVHDGNLTRLTLGHPTLHSHTNIADLTWEELAKVELPYANHLLQDELPKGSENELAAMLPERVLGQECGSSYPEALAKEPRMARLMTLREYLCWMEKHPALLTEIEIKASGAAQPIFELLADSPAAARCIVFSGNPAYLQELQQAAAAGGKPQGVRLGANIRWLTEEHKRLAQELELYEVGLNAEHISREDVCWLNDHGIEVFANLGDYVAWWEKLCGLGIAAFKTNYAAAFTRWWMESAGNEAAT